MIADSGFWDLGIFGILPMATFISRLLDLVRRRREKRLSEEVQAHLDLLTDEHLARGLSTVEARLSVSTR
jgi:hypothetical protein